MKNLYHPEDAQQFAQQYSAYSHELALRVYTSRLIGKSQDLVLHGGGNTSVKCRIKNIVDEEIDVLFVKGSGWDLGIIEPEGFTGLMLDPIQRLRRLDFLSDEEMENQLAINRIESRSPNPSVEALLHAFLPHKYIDHTHADSILILTNQKQGKAYVEEALGSRVTVIPYVMSGFPLAKAVVEAYEDIPDVDAQIQNGDFKALTAWMRDKVHRHGAKFKPQELVQRITGSKIDQEPYIRYLTSKYSEIYQL